MSLLADLRIAFRHLRSSPGFTATVVLTFAIAIAANSAVFSAVHSVLLRPLPVAEPEALAVAWQTDEGGQAVVELTYRHLREWTTAGSTFTQASAFGSHNWSGVLEGQGEPTRIWFNGVTSGFFETLGVQPLLGRTFRSSDDVPGAAPVVILNHGTWVRRFGSDPSIIGKPLRLDGESLEIIGVMPPGLDFPRGAEFWAPVVPILAGGTPPNVTALDTIGLLYIVGRLRDGLTAEPARQEIDALEARLDQDTPGRLKWGARAVVTPFVDHIFGPVRSTLWWLWGAVSVLLVIACANVSGLLLTRMSLRRREHGVRMALGATRARLSRLWITEVLLLSAAGGALGLLGASWLARMIVALAPEDVPHVASISIDGTVAGFTLAAVAGAALLSGLVPVRYLGAGRLVDALGGSGRTTASRHSLRARSSLVIVQIALAVVLLVAAGLVVRSFIRLQQLNLGFASSGVLAMVVQPRSPGLPPNQMIDQVLERIRALPEVQEAGAVYLRPLLLGPIGMGVRVGLDGQPQTREVLDRNPTLNYQAATPGYFEAMRTRLVRGRFFDERDTTQSPRVALVSESTARRLWPNEEPLGKRLSMPSFTPGAPGRAWRTVVGVVSDVRYRGLAEVQLDVYDPALQVGLPANSLVIRTAGDPLALLSPVRSLVRDLDPIAVVDEVTTMDDVVSRAAAPWRMSMWLFLLFAVLAFGLAALGLFSLVALDVAHRRHEFAVRLALGSSRGSIVRAVLRQAGWRVAVGTASGMFAAVLLTGAMQSLLFEIAPLDTVTYASVLGLVIFVVTAAAYVPARQAARTNPQVLLRS